MATQGILFDLDGTLLDTEPIYEKAYQNAIIALGGGKYTKELRAKILGREEIEGAEIIIEAHSLKVTAEEFMNERNKTLEELFPTAPLMPGAAKLTRHLASKGIPMAVATSSHRKFLAMKMKNHGEWAKNFKFIVTGDEIEHGKPAPDIFLAAAKGIGVDPKKCLVFEDSPSGTDSGAAAGAVVISIPSLDDPKRYAKATKILSSLEEFVPEEYGLPPYDSK